MSSKSYLLHLTGSKDLITTYEARRAGFVAAALEKSRLADPFIREAQTLKVKSSVAKSPIELLDNQDIQAGLLTAAGVSDKAIAHLSTDDKAFIVKEFIKNFLEPAGDKFIEELVYRYLLIRGDTLGGKIRNLAGAWAQTRVTRYILANLSLAGRPHQYLRRPINKWFDGVVDADLDGYSALSWQTDGQDRTLVFNLKVSIIKNLNEADDGKSGKNVDMCLFNCGPSAISNRDLARKMYNSPASYIALGELKGGIDPGGADEHWKTANSALSRIRDSFARLNATPHIFFVGAAIESSMANEIWGLLESGSIENAANLTDEGQIVSLTSWLCNL